MYPAIDNGFDASEAPATMLTKGIGSNVIGMATCGAALLSGMANSRAAVDNVTENDTQRSLGTGEVSMDACPYAIRMVPPGTKTIVSRGAGCPGTHIERMGRSIFADMKDGIWSQPVRLDIAFDKHGDDLTTILPYDGCTGALITTAACAR